MHQEETPKQYHTVNSPQWYMMKGLLSPKVEQYDKYIKTLTGDLDLALKKNMELRIKVEQMEEEQEIGVQQAITEIGENFTQKIKEAMSTMQIETVLSKAYEGLDGFKSQNQLKRFVKNNLDALASLRKEVILQNALINTLTAA